MERLEKLYEGKAKILYKTSDPDLMIKLSKNSKNLAKKYSWNNRVEKIQKHIQKFNID